MSDNENFPADPPEPMTERKALEHINALRGFETVYEGLRYSPPTVMAINDILIVARYVENAGGRLRSRQVMAMLLHQAEQRYLADADL